MKIPELVGWQVLSLITEVLALAGRAFFLVGDILTLPLKYVQAYRLRVAFAELREVTGKEPKELLAQIVTEYEKAIKEQGKKDDDAAG